MANTFNGIGTTFYGQRDFEADDSYVTTKWFVLAFFPLIPMSSARVRYLDSSGIPFLARSSTFEVLEELPLNGMQVISTYAYAIFIVFWCGALITKNMSPVGKLFLIVPAMLLPYALRYFAKARRS